MNYQAHYDRLIERARERVLTGYVEVHHAVPKCMGGSDDKSNLVQLTAEEHYVAHQLLHKIYPNEPGLAFAMIAMTGNRYGHRRNKAYGWVRRKHATALSGVSAARWEDPKYREKHRKSMEKMWADPEKMAKISAAVSKTHKGRVKSEQERANIAEAGRNRAPRKFSEQAKANMAAARLKTWEQRRLTGEDKVIAEKIRATRIANGSYKHTDEQKAAISQRQIGRVPWNKGLKLKQT